MPAVLPEIITQFKQFWNGTNTSPLIGVSYGKRADNARLLKPWMKGDAGWAFARAVIRAHETGDMSAISDALDVMEDELDNRGHLGCSYGTINLNTGAGCAAAFITQYARFYSGTVWFELEEPWGYDKIIALQPGLTTPYAETTFKAVETAAARFKGRAPLTTLDLGGLADVLSSLRRTEGFFYDLADRPEEAKAGLNALRAVWKSFHDRMAAIIQPANNGLHTSWTRVLSDTPYYPSQCDACAMVSPAMFDDVIWPTLNDEISAYEKTLYHLDGTGEAVHLDTMCSNPSLRVIQWVPEPTVGHADPQYFPIYEKIIALGRRIVFNGFRGEVSELTGLLKRFPKEAFCVFLDAPDYDAASRLMDALKI